MDKFYSRNLGWKITSIVLAFFLWFAVIKLDDPPEEKSFSNIPVEVLHDDVITSKNKHYYFKEAKFVDVVLKGKRSVIDKLKKDDIKASVDLQYLSFTDSVEINIETEDKDIEVVKKNPSNMIISLENIKTEIRKVTYEPTGELEESYEALEPTITPYTIEITGPESKIAMVDKVLVTIGIGGATKDVSAVGTVKLLDSSGKEVDMIEKGVEEVEVKVPIRKTKDFNVITNPTGKIPDGYKLTGMDPIPSRIKLIGTEEQIDKINNVPLDVSLNDITEDITKEFDLATILPEGVSRYQNKNSVSVRIKVDKIEEKEIEITPHDILAKIPEDFKISIVNKENIKLVFRGIEEDLSKVHVNNLNPRIYINNMEEGRHEVNLTITYITDVELVTQEIPKVVIELTKENVEDTTGNDTGTNIDTSNQDSTEANTETNTETSTEDSDLNTDTNTHEEPETETATSIETQ